MSNTNSVVSSLSILSDTPFTNRACFRYVANFQKMENYDCDQKLPVGTPHSWRFKGNQQVVLGQSMTEFSQGEMSDMHREFMVRWGTGQYKESAPNNFLLFVPIGFVTLKPGELTEREDFEDWKAGKQGW